MNHMLFMLFFSMLFPVCVYLSYILIKTRPTRGVAVILLHFSTGVRAYTVLSLPQAMNQCSPWLQIAI